MHRTYLAFISPAQTFSEECPKIFTQIRRIKKIGTERRLLRALE
jgi:hypothetical protein